MKRLGFVAALTIAASGIAAAQSATVKQESKIEVKKGKDVTLTGCVESHPDPTGAARYQLTNVADKKTERHAYLLVGDTDDLDKHVGHMVEIKGKAADSDDAKVEVKTKTKIEREGADDTKSESKSELQGDLQALPLLSVDDVKMIRPNCQ